MNLNKIKAYVGFAIKSKSIVYGLDLIKEKNVSAIIYSESLSEASKESVKFISQKNNCYCAEISQKYMTEIVGSEKIKAFAIQNKELAMAIKHNLT